MPPVKALTSSLLGTAPYRLAISVEVLDGGGRSFQIPVPSGELPATAWRQDQHG
jgi:hypothetical protein